MKLRNWFHVKGCKICGQICWYKLYLDHLLVINVIFLFVANVHRLRPEQQVHLPQCAAFNKLHAAHSGWDVLAGHTSLLPARFHLHTPARHPPAQCNEHEEEGIQPQGLYKWPHWSMHKDSFSVFFMVLLCVYRRRTSLYITGSMYTACTCGVEC